MINSVFVLLEIRIRQNEKSNEKKDEKLLRFSRESSYIFSNNVSAESQIFLHPNKIVSNQ
ncbi:hypothetical protein BpHYR1_001052 [Brachionus plicatilis]|uniref:Uncharacterized protein n=1 Tax=Brachionus plicatilis TaxID=10195 RepID=A0A3M7QDU2_BRAPC|nr:hypothetical protein BpHYR1_001052 [Brachionus plicatilis]